MSADGFSEPKVETQVPGSVEGVANDDSMVHSGTVVRERCCSCGPGGNKRAYITVFVLFVINLLNYMDRQTIAGTNIYFNQLGKFNFRKNGHYICTSEQVPSDISLRARYLPISQLPRYHLPVSFCDKMYHQR